MSRGDDPDWVGGHHELFIEAAAREGSDLPGLLATRLVPPETLRAAGGAEGWTRLEGRMTASGHELPLLLWCCSDANHHPKRFVAHVSVPLGAVGRHWSDLGGFPFGREPSVPPRWRLELDAALVELARWTHARIPLRFAIVGFEIDEDEEAARLGPDLNRVPDERSGGILLPRPDGSLRWWPPTRWV